MGRYKKIKRGVVNDNNKVVWSCREYPIVDKVLTGGYNYKEEKIEEGTELKFKIVHRQNGVHKRGGGFTHILCAQLV